MSYWNKPQGSFYKELFLWNFLKPLHHFRHTILPCGPCKSRNYDGKWTFSHKLVILSLTGLIFPFSSKLLTSWYFSLYSDDHSILKYFIGFFLFISEVANFLFPCDKQNTCVQSYFIQVFCLNQTGNAVLLRHLKVEGQGDSDVSIGHQLLGYLMASVLEFQLEAEGCARDPIRPQATGRWLASHIKREVLHL